MIKVLLIEDSPAAAAHLLKLLCEVDRESFAVTYERSLTEAANRLATEPFDAALLGCAAADDAPADIAALRAHLPNLPVVLLTRADDRAAAREAVRRGAQDFVEEDDLAGPLLERTIQWAIERVRAAERLAFLSRHDALTGLANRPAFCDRVAQALARSDRSQQPGALLLLDLDSFKTVNDTRGLETGDLVLTHVAERLRNFVRPYDVVARLGADEFGVLLEDVNEARDAGRLAERMLGVIAEPFRVGESEVFTSASLGVVVFPFDGRDAPTLLRNADFAMYRAKRQGGGTCAFYTPSMGVRIHEQLALEHDLHRALAREEFVLHYQPQVSLKGGHVVGLEALLRWHHPTRGTIPPAAFVPAAEKSGAIGAIGEWALRTACRQRRAWSDAGLALGRIAVNLSPRQLVTPGFVTRTERILQEADLDPRLLELEITEALFLDDDPVTIEKLARLKRLGVRISIDDFGTGYSCLSQLTDLPVDGLKIDRSLVAPVRAGRQSAVVTRAIVVLARELGLGVTCEGVENDAQVDFLREHGCDAIQGVLVSPPLPTEEVPVWATSSGRCEAGSVPSDALTLH
jgi:diguanylate cyclase (GGDEF)-like protein